MEWFGLGGVLGLLNPEAQKALGTFHTLLFTNFSVKLRRLLV
jgi:hypothetical protein